MKTSECETILKKLIIENSVNLLEPNMIDEKTDLIEDLNYDSITAIALITEIERTFDIELDETLLQLEIITHYANLRNCVIEKVCNKL